MKPRGLVKERTGVVTSNRMQKTVVVAIERTVAHPKYKKYLRRRTKVKAHDESNQCRVGDRVLIIECRPLSSDKRWRVRQVIGRTKGTGQEEADNSGASPAV
jgi:small subunit ribosomal protein S17